MLLKWMPKAARLAGNNRNMPTHDAVGRFKTDEQRAQDKAKRLLKNYGWSAEMVEKLSAKQGHRCGICGRPASDFKYGLNVDHAHFVIEAKRTELNEVFPKGWLAVARFKDERVMPWLWGKTKAAAISAARSFALPLSVRGLLCPGRHGPKCCNRLLGRVDNIPWLENALNYLKNPPAQRA